MRQNNVDAYKDSKLVIDYKVKHGVTNGYACFEQTNINMYYSKGAIKISPVSDFSTLELQKHISSSKEYEENQQANKYFIWFTKEEEEKYRECIE